MVVLKNQWPRALGARRQAEGGTAVCRWGEWRASIGRTVLRTGRICRFRSAPPRLHGV